MRKSKTKLTITIRSDSVDAVVSHFICCGAVYQAISVLDLIRFVVNRSKNR